MNYFARVLLLCFYVMMTPSIMVDAFPIGRCNIHTCKASPYTLEWISPLCFRAKNKLCIDASKYGCCSVFENYVNKIILTMDPICNTSVQQVTVNGNVKGGGLYPQDNEFKITSLNLFSSSNITSAIICLKLVYPCTDMQTFCGGKCSFALFNVDKHTCCPTCHFTSQQPSSLQPLLPPSPPQIPSLQPLLPPSPPQIPPSPSQLQSPSPSSSQHFFSMYMKIKGAFTTVKAIQINEALHNLTSLPYSQVLYINKQQGNSNTFHLEFMFGPFQSKESLELVKTLISNNITQLSILSGSRIPGTFPLDIIMFNLTLQA